MKVILSQTNKDTLNFWVKGKDSPVASQVDAGRRYRHSYPYSPTP